MRSISTRLLAAGLLFIMPFTAFAWGHQGHEVIGAIADRMLNERAKEQVSQILGISLEVASRWPDCAKDVKVSGGQAKYTPMSRYHAACGVFETQGGIERMEDYVARNSANCDQSANREECHKQYHYTDVNYQHSEYNASYIGTSKQDVVHAIDAATAVLRGEPAPAPFDIKDKQEALLLIAHFIGDIHQPLHVGAIYLDAEGKAIDPDAFPSFDPKTETRGGNSIIVGTSGNLHSNWDTIAKNMVPSQVSATLLSAAKKVPVTQGPANDWPAAWASDTLAASRIAFSGITFSPGERTGQWTASFEDRQAYLATKNRVQREQMVKAGARLAEILNNVWK